jgi:hypothetical protein
VRSFSAALKCRTRVSKFSHTAETKWELDATHMVLKILRVFSRGQGGGTFWITVKGIRTRLIGSQNKFMDGHPVVLMIMFTKNNRHTTITAPHAEVSIFQFVIFILKYVFLWT